VDFVVVGEKKGLVVWLDAGMEDDGAAGIGLAHFMKDAKDVRILQVGDALILEVIDHQGGMAAMIADHAQNAKCLIALAPACGISAVARSIDGGLRDRSVILIGEFVIVKGKKSAAGLHVAQKTQLIILRELLVLAQVAVVLQRIEAQGFGGEIGFAGKRGIGPQAIETPIAEFDGGVKTNALSVQGQDGVTADSFGLEPAKAEDLFFAVAS
jgi:hypothetical protein